MALTQRELKEVAEEALQAARAFDILRFGFQEVLERSDISPEAKLELLRYILRDQPLVGCTRSEAALEHIGRTSKRNQKRALAAREARSSKKGANGHD